MLNGIFAVALWTFHLPLQAVHFYVWGSSTFYVGLAVSTQRQNLFVSRTPQLRFHAYEALRHLGLFYPAALDIL